MDGELDFPIFTEPVNLPLGWYESEELPYLWANQAMIQIGSPKELLLSFGQVRPPVFTGTSQEQHQQAESLTSVPCKIIGRVSIGIDSAAELFKILDTTLKAMNTMVAPSASPDVPKGENDE